jgi:two-component system sensor histidine kinase KdpD
MTRMPTRPDRPRPWLGITAGAVVVVAATGVFAPFSDSETLAIPALVLVLPVMLAGVLGGWVAAVVVAVMAAAAFSFAFIDPIGSILAEDVVALVVFLVVALVVGALVAEEAARRRTAQQRADEIEAMHERYRDVVAERERLAEEAARVAVLEEVDRQRAALLRSVSHDLRTPLVTIRGATSDLRDGAIHDTATSDELLDLVIGEAERLDRIVANLLNLSRIEAGALRPDAQPLEVEELVSICVQRLQRLFADSPLLVELAPDLPLVSADHSQVDQVLTNLLENAARHSPAGKPVEIEAVAGDGVVEISVSDHGSGIDPALREHLFEPFQSSAPAPTVVGASALAGSHGSTGIGLAICKAIVQAHGGTITVGDTPGGGARFSFTLPVAP